LAILYQLSKIKTLTASIKKPFERVITEKNVKRRVADYFHFQTENHLGINS